MEPFQDHSSNDHPRSLAWSKRDPFGAEFASVDLGAERMAASGVAIGSSPEPYRLDYTLQTTRNYLTNYLSVRASGDGWQRKVQLRRKNGRWRAEVEQSGDTSLPDAGGDVGGLDDALDPDLGLSPLFNSLPVLRHDLHRGGDAREFLMVWISVPALSLHASRQRYTHIGHRHGIHLVRFDAIGDGEDFTAEVEFDDDGLVRDYPGIAARLPAHLSP